VKITQVEADLVVFARYHVATGDIDPAYPVLRNLMDRWALTTEERLWLLTLHLAYYQIGSAMTAFEWTAGRPARRYPDAMRRLPCNTERRGLRGGKVVDYLDVSGQITGYGTQERYWLAGLPDEPERAFDVAWARAQAIPYNGRWAAFKWIDLLMHTMDAPIVMPDMRLEQCTGPREGLAWLYGIDDDATDSLTMAGEDVRGRLARKGQALPWDQVETVLCDWNSLRKGRYYVGNDIDSQLHDLETAGGIPNCYDDAMHARRESFPDAYLGERHGWTGPDRERKRVYRDTGVVILR